MKKSKLYTVTKGNRPAFMHEANIFDGGGSVATWDKLASKAYGANYGDSGYTMKDYMNSSGNNWFGISKENNPFSKGNLTNFASGLVNSLNPLNMLSGAGEALLAGVGKAIRGNKVATNTVTKILDKVPLLGDITTGLLGVEYDENTINAIKDNADKMSRTGKLLAQVTDSGSFFDIAGDMGSAMDFNYSDLGSTGLLRSNNALKREQARLNKKQNAALGIQSQGMLTGASNVDQTLDDNVMGNFVYAFGGPMNPYSGALGLMQNDNYINAINNRSAAIMGKNADLSNPQNYFGEGGGIHISPSKRGTFTAAASKHNMGVQEFARKVLANKDDYSPAMVKKANFARNVSKFHAFGGELGTNGTDWTNGLLYVDAGGTHQQNPLGGVPVGFDQNGTPNLVEEGETIWNDYVFSNRIKVPKAMFHTLGLGGAMKKGLTFADASKKLAKESEQRPNDPISLDGLNISLAKLAAVQEAERMKKQMRQSVGLENMAAYGGPVNKFVDGGDVKNTNIPAEYQGTYQDIVNWLMENNLEASDASIRKYAKDFYDNKSFNSNKASAYKWLLDNTDYNQAVITKLADLMAKRPSANMSGNFSPEDAFYSLIPTRLFTEGNIEKYLKNFMDNGLSFDDAWNVVNHSTPKEESLQQRRYNAQLQAKLRDKYDKGLSPVADSVSSKELPEEVSTNPDTEWGIQNAMQEATRRGVSAEIAPSSGSDYAGASDVRSVGSRNNGINPYAYDNSRWGEFEYYNPQTRQYDEGYLNFAKNINQDWVNRILAGTYGDMSRYLSRNNGYQITPQEVGILATDGKLSDMHKAMQAAYRDYLKGINPVTGEITQTEVAKDPYGASVDPIVQEKEQNIPTPADAVNGNPRAIKDNDTDVDTQKVVENPYTPLGTRLRYAPVFGNALAVLSDLFNKPDYTYPNKLEAAAYAAGQAPTVSYQPIGDYIRYSPFDIWAAQNRLDANNRATQRAMLNQASPSRDAGLAALAYAENIGAGQLQRQAAESNLAQKQQVADFNIRPNMFNSQMGLEAAMANARYGTQARAQQMQGIAQVASLRDAIDRQYSAARSANLTNFFNSLGNIGRENFIFNQINSDKSRSYYVDPVTGEGYYVMRPKEKKSCGGKMNKK